MTQNEQVVEAMERCGGYATFAELNQCVDTSSWQTMTPAATIRRIVQTHQLVFHVAHGDLRGVCRIEKVVERALHKASGRLRSSPSIDVLYLTIIPHRDFRADTADQILQIRVVEESGLVRIGGHSIFLQRSLNLPKDGRDELREVARSS